MRTIQQIKQNASLCSSMFHQLDEQISLLENEYQTNAVEMTGDRSEEWDNYISILTQAKQALNALAHMEADLALDLEYPETDD